MSKAVGFVFEALARKWIATALVLVLGAVLALHIVSDPPAGLQPRYSGVAEMRVAKLTLTGVDIPCTAATTAQLAKSPRVLDRAALDPTFSAPALTSSMQGDILVLAYLDTDRARAARIVSGVANNVSTWCSAATIASYKRYNWWLAQTKEQRQAEMRSLDAVLLPGAKNATALSALEKTRTLLVAAQEHAAQASDAANVAAAAAAKQRSDVVPVAVQEIASADPTYTTLQTQYQKDVVTLQSMSAHYQPNYPPIQALQQKTASERAALNVKADAFRNGTLMLSATYRAVSLANDTAQTAARTANDTKTAADAQVAAVDAQIAAIPNAAVRLAALQRHRVELLKDYQTLSAQYATAFNEQAQIPQTGPLIALTERIAIVHGLWALIAALSVFALALALGIAAAVMLQLLDRRLLTVASVTKLYAKPVIATLRVKPKS